VSYFNVRPVKSEKVRFFDGRKFSGNASSFDPSKRLLVRASQTFILLRFQDSSRFYTTDKRSERKDLSILVSHFLKINIKRNNKTVQTDDKIIENKIL